MTEYTPAVLDGGKIKGLPTDGTIPNGSISPGLSCPLVTNRTICNMSGISLSTVTDRIIYETLPIQNTTNIPIVGFALLDTQWRQASGGSGGIYVPKIVSTNASPFFTETNISSTNNQDNFTQLVGYPLEIKPGMNVSSVCFTMGGASLDVNTAAFQSQFSTIVGFSGYNVAYSDLATRTASSTGTGSYEDISGMTATITVSASSKILVLISQTSNNGTNIIRIADGADASIKTFSDVNGARTRRPLTIFHLTDALSAGTYTVKLRIDPLGNATTYRGASIFLMEIPATALSFKVESFTTPTTSDATIATLSGISYSGYKRFLLFKQFTGVSGTVGTDYLLTRFASYNGTTEIDLLQDKKHCSELNSVREVFSHHHITIPLTGITEFRLKASKTSGFTLYAGEEFIAVEMPNR
jgi:hypothetical protein